MSRLSVEATQELEAMINRKQLVFGVKIRVQDEDADLSMKMDMAQQLRDILMQDVIEIDCRAACKLAEYMALQKWLGDQCLNALYSNYLANKDKVFPDTYIKEQYYYKPEGFPHHREELVPGDWVNLVNPNAITPWDNENAIYVGRNALGQQMFFGHPYGTKSLEEWKAILSEKFDENNNGKTPVANPYLEKIRYGIDYKENYDQSVYAPK